MRRMSRLLRHWPGAAFLSWLFAWMAVACTRALGLSVWSALGVGLLVTLALAACQALRWRRAIVALGFPASVIALGLPGELPGWLWLAPLALLWLLYPQRTWADAPVFPTPPGALAPLAELAAMPAGARLLDAGCGAGDGLRELCRVYPQARVEGIEWSRPLRLLSRLRAPRAHVLGGDMWALNWGCYQLVYVFQRPESMPRVWSKALTDLQPGAWLVSLDFAVPQQTPLASWQLPSGLTVYAYQPMNAPAMPAI
jgi:hypothetical protein